MSVVHSIIHASFGRNSRTRCGIVGSVMNATTDLAVYSLLAENGNTIGATTRNSAITCKKCLRSKPSKAQLPEELRDAR